MRPMRNDEEGCKAAFHSFLSEALPSINVIWDQGSEPPDYYLLIANTRYAVEVMTAREQVNVNNTPVSDLSILVPLQRFLKQIEQEAIRNGILTGAYSVRFAPIDNFGKIRRQIKKEIITYLSCTQHYSSAPAQAIIGDGQLRWEIKKYHSDRTYLSGGTADAKFHGEASRELSTLLDQILTDKTRKLAAIPKPWILLVANRYPWLEHSDWNSSAVGLESINEFHTVFLISRDRGTHVLHSQNADWAQLRS